MRYKILINIIFLIFIIFILKIIKSINNFYFNSPILFYGNKPSNNMSKLDDNLDETFSVCIIDDEGNIIYSYNDEKPRLPASNIKLFTSAYIISKFSINDNLQTTLYRKKKTKNEYLLHGMGDPDLNYQDIFFLISKISENKEINLDILEIDSINYYPNGWTDTDKLYEYGVPTTPLAIKSNHNKYEDIESLKNFIQNYLQNKFHEASITINISNEYKIISKNKDYLNLSTINSSPIYSLLSLINSESHNFTAESVYKNASKTWNTNNYNDLKKWLKNKGLPLDNISIADASGLSRNNKVTTKLLALFLHKMKFNKNFNKYISSLSIMGLRGTLAKRGQGLKGKFFGKTGILPNVNALSGYLYLDDKYEKSLSISIIQNSENIDKEKVFDLLQKIYNFTQNN